MASQDKPLSSIVEISRKFLRSIQIDDDFGRDDALSGYVCQGTARTLLESMAHQLLETQQRAFTWTGPYGGGKSSLALTLCSLVGPDRNLRDRAKKILSIPPDSPIHKAFDAKGTGWTVLPVVGKRASVRDQIVSAIEKRTRSTIKKKKNADVIADLVALAEKNKQGLLLIIDELGKFLEHLATDSNEDIYFFQQLAEAASRAKGKLVVVGILHQPFEAYASGLGRQTRDDWAKIQGRYIDIPLVAATDEIIELIGQSIRVSEKIDLRPFETVCSTIAESMKKRRPAAPPNLVKSLLACWPLHPVTASLLGPMSRRKFGQNERSIFGFLASREPLGFSEFLQSQSALGDSLYRPEHLWDYLRSNAEPAILASPDGHRWAQSVDSVERAEAKGTALHIAIAKSVALIEMFRSGAGVAADFETVLSSIKNATSKDVERALANLLDWKILIERKHLNAYGVFAGSDFDIEGAINTARNEISAFSSKLIAELADLNPIIAKRLYHETGTMRWFSKSIIPVGELSAFIEQYQPLPGSVGSFILCVPESQTSEKALQSIVGDASTSSQATSLILGIPKNGKKVADLSHELAAAERVFTTKAELDGDPVARREIASRISSLRGALQEELTDSFRSANWFQNGEKLSESHNSTLSELASSVAEEIFYSTPCINSELINRDDLSSNVVKARRELMYRMLKHSSESKLGYEGYPADAGLYYTVLHNAGLHLNRPRNGGWGFGKPRNDGEVGTSYLAIWSETEELLRNSQHHVRLSEIYALWEAPPYGLKKGTMPIIAFAFFLAHKAHIALYLNNVFTPNISEVVIDELLHDPRLISFKYVNAGENKSSLAESISRIVLVSKISESETPKLSPLDTARGLVSIVVDLPNWTKRTNSISEAAQNVRNMLLKASDPHKVLYADLPTILGSNSEHELVERLTSVVTELKTAYSKKLADIRAAVLDSLQQGAGSTEELKTRAQSIKGITGDFQLESFVTRLEEFDGSDSATESLISNAINKPSQSWVDRDLDLAIIQLGALATSFRKAEALAGLRGRTSPRKSFNLVLSSGQGKDLSRAIEISQHDQSKIDAAVSKILPILTGIDSRIVYAALADIGVKFAVNEDEINT
jgi:hypothetical protein